MTTPTDRAALIEILRKRKRLLGKYESEVVERNRVICRHEEDWERSKAKILGAFGSDPTELGTDRIEQGKQVARATLHHALHQHDVILWQIEQEIIDLNAQIVAFRGREEDVRAEAEKTRQALVSVVTVQPPIVGQREFIKAQNSVPSWVVVIMLCLGIIAVSQSASSGTVAWTAGAALILAAVSTVTGVVSTISTIRRNRRIDAAGIAVAAGAQPRPANGIEDASSH